MTARIVAPLTRKASTKALSAFGGLLKSLLVSPILLAVAAGCGTTWKGADNDGDGFSAADGDCWDSESSPVAGFSGKDIYPGAPDAFYDGVDSDCAGNDDFDADLDGYVRSSDEGSKTWGVDGSGTLPGGDCFDFEDAKVEDGLSGDFGDFRAVDGFDQPLPSMVFPGAEDPLYDDIDQDCAGEDADANGARDDFDQDLDGYESSVMPDREGLLGGDCAEGAPGEDPNVNPAGIALAEIHPDATDPLYDGTDQDCSGVDTNADGVLDDCDADLDGASGDDTADDDGDSCELLDCDDNNAAAVPDPDITEIPYNGVDDNCLLTRDGVPDVDGDADADGYWDVDYLTRVPAPGPTVTLPATYEDCWDDPSTLPEGWTLVDTYAFYATADMTDPSGLDLAYVDPLTAGATHPGAIDRPYDNIDQDCAGEDADGSGTPDDWDWDGDGHLTLYQPSMPGGGDCMDCSLACAGAEGELLAICEVVCDDDSAMARDPNLTNPGALYPDEVSPDALETWGDGTDADCNQASDFDEDLDGYAIDDYVASDWAFEAERPYYYGTTVIDGGDCNDDNLAIRPDAPDAWYDGVDADCEDNDDYDQDADGYVPTTYVGRATTQGAGTASFGGALPGDDCNDLVATTNPGATEVWYDGLDVNCADDDDYDADADRYVRTADMGITTNHGAGTASFGGTFPGDDCNDSVTTTNPGATDTWYDGLDQNCSDNDDYDQDGDGYVPTTYAGRTTNHGTGTTAFGGALPSDDCNDTSTSFRPGASDIWYDGFDNNCSDNDDYDQDGDGYVPTIYASRTTNHGTGTTAFGGTLPSDDCNDTLTSYNPGQSDAWYDGLDNDCADNDDYDKDGDTYVPTTYVGRTTSQGAGGATFGGTGGGDDCNDNVSTINPGRTEIWYDGTDSNCSDNDDYDQDADGYVPTAYVGLTTAQGSGTTAYGGALPGDDCNDTLSTVRPGLSDTWYDGIDTNCSDNDDYDRDADGHVRVADAGRTTTHGTGTSAFGGGLPANDCDDTVATVYGGATDTWYDGVDNDCAGNDDYDRDADGYASDAYAGSYGPTTYVTGSGSLPTTDCNDNVSTVRPGLTDTWYDGVDTNCGDNDDYDRDGDGYIPTIYDDLTTNQGSGTSSFGGALPTDDCNDTLSTIRPGLADTWYDGIDTDCSDNDDYDRDGDLYVRTADVGRTTTHGAGTTAFAGTYPGDDCNDGVATTKPGATDAWYDGLDQDCADNDDYDRDVDGYVATAYAGRTTNHGSGTTAFAGTGLTNDCNDAVASVHTGATDTWYDGVDSNCTSNDDYDQDADGYVPTTYVGRTTTQGTGTSAFGGGLPGNDCQDTLFAIKPSAIEVCDSVDNDCDSLIDDADPGRDASTTGSTFYDDDDADTYGDPGDSTLSCLVPTGYVANDDDCDDTAFAVKPGAVEVCDDDDNDCDGLTDDADTGVGGVVYGLADRWYADTDVDTYGDAAAITQACDQPAGTVSNDDDCDDDEFAIKPGANEVCDEQDNDCDGLTDDLDPGVDALTFSTFWRDADSDDFGTSTLTDQACAAPTGYVSPAAGEDCNDADSNINPDAVEVCDANVDNDCDGDSDDDDVDLDDSTGSTFYADSDSDTFGDPLVTDDRCEATAAWVANDDDCDDDDGANYPGNTEVCDGSDNDCDTLADDADASLDLGTATTFYDDDDGDTRGDPLDTIATCVMPAGYVANANDCDDTEILAWTGKTEVCDDVDNDCDGDIDDDDAGIDVSSQTSWFIDDDGDGYGDDADPGTISCDAPSLDHVDNDDDCDDTVTTTYLDAPELHNGIDDDCDTYVDDDQVVAGTAYVVITEIAYRAINSVGDTNGEWIELHNPTGVDVVLDGAWKFADNGGSLTFSSAAPLVVPAGGYAVIARNTDSLTNGGLTAGATFNYVSWSTGTTSGTLALANTNGSGGAQADVINLQYNDPDDGFSTFTTYETVQYWNNANSWPQVGTPTTSSYTVQLTNDSVTGYPADNNTGSNWCKPTTAVTYGTTANQYGTPGAANQDCTP